MLKKTIINLLFLFLSKVIFSQTYYDYGFVRDLTVVVKDSSSQILEYPWAGGLNSCHFNSIDINFDGFEDLIVFDKCGNKIMPFINNGISGNSNYTFSPEYENLFPKIKGWMQLKDYNCDGLKDLFAYSPAGIQVWKNTSDTILKFNLVTPLLNSWQGAGYSNISLTYVDYPAIDDIDNDGDLDILVFFGLGAYIQMHHNNSMELYGNCDSLIFEKTFNCWGNFAENASSNQITLNISCPWKCNKDLNYNPENEIKHTGSTMLLLDANNDGLKDLILGDVDYMNLILLINGGTSDTANMIQADTSFPSETTPVNLPSFPSASYIDIDNDSINEMLISTFEANYYTPESFKSIWLYENSGTNTSPVFSFVTDNFIQQNMIETGSGAYPVISDIDADGLKDIIVANYGYLDSTYYQYGYLYSVFSSKLSFYKNTGTQTAPEFSLITRDFAGLSQYKFKSIFPAFGDLDNDGDNDLITGEANGKLYYFENTAGQGNPPVYTLLYLEYQSIDVGDFSTPALADIDNDSLIDLIIGKKTGTLTWYKNTGTISFPVFTKITDELGKVNVIDPTVSYYGYTTPCFVRDSSGYLKLFSGSEQGKLFYYKDIENNLYGKFTAVDSVLIFINKDSVTEIINDGIRSGIAIADLNSDGYFDLIAGNFSGGLTYYKGSIPKPSSNINQKIFTENIFIIYPNPANEILNISRINYTRQGQFSINIVNTLGVNILSYDKINSDFYTINISLLPQGIFYVIISSEENHIKQSYKLIISR